MRLGDVLTQRRERVQPDVFGTWQPITVRLNGDISPRARSAAFKGQMFAAYPGDIVFSKIDARHGAIGVLPATIAKAVVTPEFPVFTPAGGKADEAYLGLLTRTKHFVMSLAARASGTSGRKRITPGAFASLQIPLPSLEEQRALVAAYDGAIKKADSYDAAAEEEELAAVQSFAGSLSLAPPPPLPNRPIFVARFAALDRWGHEAALRQTTSGLAATSPWPIVRLGDVIGDLENGWSPQCLNRQAKPDEWGVLKLGAVSSGSFDGAQNKALPTGASGREKITVTAGDVLIVRGSGQTRLVGAATYVRCAPPNIMFPDLMFRVIFDDATPLDPEFLVSVLQTENVRAQIESARTGAAPMMQKITKPALLALTFPLPPMDVQRTLIGAVNAARARAATLRQRAQATRAAARDAFEAAIWEMPTTT